MNKERLEELGLEVDKVGKGMILWKDKRPFALRDGRLYTCISGRDLRKLDIENRLGFIFAMDLKHIQFIGTDPLKLMLELTLCQEATEEDVLDAIEDLIRFSNMIPKDNEAFEKM